MKMKKYIQPLLKIKNCTYHSYLCAGGSRWSSHGNDGSDEHGNGDWQNEGYPGDPIGVGDDDEGLGSMSKRHGLWDY